jgi:hypothetical protein
MQRVRQLLLTCYAEAEIACRNLDLDESEADNTRWAIRRAKIEGGLRRIIIPPMTAEVVYGRDAAVPHPWNHTLITSGNVLITQCPVQTPDEVARPSFQREIYSLPNDERYLFQEMQPLTVPNTNPLYAIIAHGRELGTVDQLGFAYVRFPRPGANAWYPERINVLSGSPDFGREDGGQEIDRVPEEDIRDPEDPQIRDQDNSA